MTWWLIILIVAAVLFLIGQLRVGARIRYNAGGLVLAVIAGPARIQVYPAKKHRKRSKPVKKKKTVKREKAQEEKESTGRAKQDRPSTVARVLDLLPVLADAAGALRRKIVIHNLDLKVVWGAEDAASAAIGFGRAYGIIGMIWPVFDHNFHVKRHDFQVEVDYDSKRPEIDVDLALTMTIGQVLAFALRFGGRALSRWSRSGRSSPKRQEVISHERTKSSD